MNYIVEAEGLWYEGTSANLRLMLQHPTVLPINFVGDESKIRRVFLEEYFNSATRIRRGRLYDEEPSGGRPTWWPGKISHFPYAEQQRKGFHVNASYKAAESLVMPGWTAILGDNNAQSYWTVVFSEKAGLDAHYLTLKSKTYFGVLPEVNRDAIPEANRQDILQALDAVVEAAPIQAPQPVIDACRNTACHMITAKFSESNPKGDKDLGKLVAWLEREGRGKDKPGRKTCTEAASALVCMLDSYAGYLIKELHSRAKANASADRKTRPVSRQDANLAVDAIAFLLQDFGWAEEGI